MYLSGGPEMGADRPSTATAPSSELTMLARTMAGSPIREELRKFVDGEVVDRRRQQLTHALIVARRPLSA